MTKEVMLIDDDLEDHQLFAERLAEYNESIKVIPAYDGPEALKILEKASPDYIFLDMNMPKMNGLEVLEKLKEHETLKSIPVYIYSTSDGYITGRPAIKLGAVQYFQKPENSEGLKIIFTSVFENNSK